MLSNFLFSRSVNIIIGEPKHWERIALILLYCNKTLIKKKRCVSGSGGGGGGMCVCVCMCVCATCMCVCVCVCVCVRVHCICVYACE